MNLTTGGAPYMTVQERVKPAEVFKPEVASLNMGSMNFGLFPMLDRFKTFKHDWEQQALENSRDLVFRNTYKDIEFVLRDARRRGHAVRVRVLRHVASLQPRPFPRARAGEAAALRADRVRHPRRHRPASGGRAAHEAHRRSPVRRATTDGRCSAPAATSWRSPRSPPPWAAMCASASRIRSGPDRAGSRRATPSRCALCGRSSRDSACSRDARTRRARFWSSRAATSVAF